MPFSPTPILSLLDTHSPSDPTELAHTHAFRALLSRTSPPLPNDRALLPPLAPGHLTASVFVVALSPTPSLLLLEHPKLHRLLQPGGHLEPHESDPRLAALRELLEETGIDLPPAALTLLDFDIHTIPPNPKKNEPAHDHYDIRYLATLPQIPPPPLIPPTDPAPLRWLPLTDLQSLPPDEGLRRVFQKLPRTPQPPTTNY